METPLTIEIKLGHDSPFEGEEIEDILYWVKQGIEAIINDNQNYRVVKIERSGAIRKNDNGIHEADFQVL
jgi:hypothetical protein